MVDLEAVYRFLGFSDPQQLPQMRPDRARPRLLSILTFCLTQGLHSVEVETLTIITQQCAADFHNPSLTTLEFGALSHELQ